MRITNLATQFNASDRSPHIVRVGQCIGLDLNRVFGVWSGQTDASAALRPYNASKQCPGPMWRVELGRCLGAAQRHFRLASLKIGCVQSRIAFPEERCLPSIVARGEGLLILPHTANSKMILKVLPHTWKVLDNRNSQSL